MTVPQSTSTTPKWQRWLKGRTAFAVLGAFVAAILVFTGMTIANSNARKDNFASITHATAPASAAPSAKPTATAPTSGAKQKTADAPPVKTPVIETVSLSGKQKADQADAKAAKLTSQQETYAQLAAQKHQVEGVDYRFNIDRNLAAQVNPGIDTFGSPVFNEQELVARLADGSANSNLAIAAFQERELSKNGFTVTRAEALNAQNYQCVQMLKPNESGDMASVTTDGTVNWAGNFIDPAYSVACAYVGTQVAHALAAGHPVVSIGFRGNCINVMELPVVVNKQPTLPQPRVVIINQQTPPPAKTIVVHHKPKPPVVVPPKPPKMTEFCFIGSGNQTLQPIEQSKFNPKTMTTDTALCAKKVVIKACIKGSGNTNLVAVDRFDSATMSTNPKDCEKPPIMACVIGSGNQTLREVSADKWNPKIYTTDIAKCVSTCACVPPPIQRCDTSTNPWTIVTITQEEAKNTDRYKDLSAKDCVKPVPPVCDQSKHHKKHPTDVWDETKCDYVPCPPPVVCKQGTFPNPSNPSDCLVNKDPVKSPPPADGHHPAKPPVGKTPPPAPIAHPINPVTPPATPAPPITKTPGTTPTPVTPVPPVETPAPTPIHKGTPIADPDQPAAVVPAAVPAAQQAAPVAAPTPVVKAAPVVQTPVPAVATTPAAESAPAVHAAAPVGATSAPVATTTAIVPAAPAAATSTTVAAAPVANVEG